MDCANGILCTGHWLVYTLGSVPVPLAHVSLLVFYARVGFLCCVTEELLPGRGSVAQLGRGLKEIKERARRPDGHGWPVPCCASMLACLVSRETNPVHQSPPVSLPKLS